PLAMIIDTHAHIYSPDKTTYPTIEGPYSPPPGTGDPDHLRAEMLKAGVDRACLIQTSTFYRWDNRFTRDTSAGATDWAAGVCTLDPDNVHSAEIMYSLVDRANIKGMRSVPAADGSLDHPGVRALWAQAQELGIVINVLVPLNVADQLARMLDDYPDLNVVLDHCLSLTRGPQFESTVAAVVELARRPNLHAKLTFLGTGSAERYPFSDMHEALRMFVDAYGPDRCVWGSDFPTELWCPRVNYNDHLTLFQEDLGLSAGEQEAILGGTAERLWFGG
ncbi:MAG: amidohydrolase family protein, partial [Dehalococcoidia bacterium]